MAFYTYILASRPGEAIYVGSTGNLRRRVEEHRSGAISGHTKTYCIHTLVWFEIHETREGARTRVRSIKRWRRAWKDEAIASVNPTWRDLCDEIPL